MLLTFLSDADVPALRAVLDEFAARSVVAVAAGNEADAPLGPTGSALAGTALVAAAVDVTGAPAWFTQEGPQVVWAPGTSIPVILGENRQAARDGTSYSAAIAAALAARLIAEFPDATPTQVVQALRDTSLPANGRETPSILNLHASRVALSETER